MYKKVFISSMALIVALTGSLMATRDISKDIPEINMGSLTSYEKISDAAQYGEADWSGVVGIARGITLSEAARIADERPEVTFFFYMKGGFMALGTGNTNEWRVFHHGDAVFFTGEPSLGSAQEMADTYIKR